MDMFGEIVDSTCESTERATNRIVDALCTIFGNRPAMIIFFIVAIFGSISLLTLYGVIGNSAEERVRIVFDRGHCNTLLDVDIETKRFEKNNPGRVVVRTEYEIKGCLDYVTFVHVPKPNMSHPLSPPME